MINRFLAKGKIARRVGERPFRERSRLGLITYEHKAISTGFETFSRPIAITHVVSEEVCRVQSGIALMRSARVCGSRLRMALGSLFRL